VPLPLLFGLIAFVDAWREAANLGVSDKACCI